MVCKGKFSWLIFLIGSIVNLTIANPIEGNLEAVSHADDDVVYDIDSLYEFLAARGRRSKDNDLFWANRGKRSHDIYIRDMLGNRPKPNGFNFLMGKRSLIEPGMKKNALKPNGFNFLLAGKRSSGMPRPNSFLFPVKREVFNIPRPNGFIFPQIGKRGSGHANEEYFNSPKPTSFSWPSMLGKRTSDDVRAAWRNMARPTGFMFSMAKGKRSDEEGPEFFDDDEEMMNDDLFDEMDELSTHFVDENEVDASDVESMGPRDRRSSMTSSSNVQPQDYHTFFAGRGKKSDSRGSTAGSRSGPTRSGDSFFAGRGKKGTDVDMFVAGRGK